MKKTRYRFDILNPLRDNKQEQFTGVFETKELADDWYEKHGKPFWEAKGRVLVRVKTGGV